MPATRQNLLGMDQSQLAELAENLGERPYRGRQLFGWLYAQGVDDIGAMSDLSREFRQRLALATTVQGIAPVDVRRSPRDGTTKFLFALSDGRKIESVLIPPASAFSQTEGRGEDEQTRLTLCVSSQAGCPLDCAFCATATMGFARNLTTGEIIDQFRQAQRSSEKRITNVVFMGMGEPLMNYDNVMRAIDILSAGMGIAARRITVSTAGWADGIRRMGEEQRKPKLALSLHSAVEATRARLMPVAKRHSLEELRAALGFYYRRTRRRVTYEQVFFAGVNDSDRELAALIKFARLVPCKVNVIPYHSIAFTGKGTTRERLEPSPRAGELVERLREAHLTVMVRSNAGEDIEGACGQLAVLHDKEVPARGKALRRSHGS
jgi:23S rRNA (adenine2503-C2)-methyltransferase